MGSAVQTEPLEVEEDKGLSGEYVFNNEDLQAVLDHVQAIPEETQRLAPQIERQEIRVIEGSPARKRKSVSMSPERNVSPTRASPLC